jgi:hypothetical protein
MERNRVKNLVIDGSTILNGYSRNRIGGPKEDSFGCDRAQVLGCCEHGNEHLDNVKYWEYFA